LSSNLVGRIDPRFIAGTGTLVAAAALFMFSQIEVDDGPGAVLSALGAQQPVGDGVSYWTSLFPYILLMAVGMGMVFVPLTLTAVHRVQATDSGIGSGVLNTMQQVGGALGLATLSTVALHFTNSRADELAGPLAQQMANAGIDPQAPVAGSDLSLLELGIFQGSFTDGATNAFLVGSLMMLAASAIIWVFLDVKHTELATDGPEAPVHVG